MYAIVLAYVATLMVYVGSTGPYWIRVEYASDGCDKIWWKHLLYSEILFNFAITIFVKIYRPNKSV